MNVQIASNNGTCYLAGIDIIVEINIFSDYLNSSYITYAIFLGLFKSTLTNVGFYGTNELEVINN